MHAKAVYEYAREYFSAWDRASDTLDAKADGVWRYAAVLGGIYGVTANVLAGRGAEPGALALSFLPSMVALLLALLLAARATSPTRQPFAGESGKLVEAVKMGASDEQIRAKLAAYYHCASVGARLHVLTKACSVRWAFWCLAGGLLLSMLPMLLLALR